MLAQIARAGDVVVEVPLLGRLERAMHQVPDLAEAARDEARHLAEELRIERRERVSLALRLGEALGEARRLADVARGYRNGLVFWFLTAGLGWTVAIVATLALLRGGG